MREVFLVSAVVGRVVEVESIGVGGCTRRPVLDFRPAGGVIVTDVGPSCQVTPRRVVPARFSWVCANDGWGPVVRNAECGRDAGVRGCVVSRVVEVEFIGVRGCLEE